MEYDGRTVTATHGCVCRLRCLVKQLEKGEVSVSDLKKNLEYAALVLESLYVEQTRSGHCAASSYISTVCISAFHRHSVHLSVSAQADGRSRG